ncbi:MAG: hypothetical protein ABI538_13990 [Pseudoxanthomonas sp.]
MKGVRIAGWVISISAAVVALMVLPLLKSPEVLLPPPADDAPSFELTREFAVRNAPVVLRTALAGLYKLAGHLHVASGEPADRLDSRRSLGVLAFPKDRDCISIQFKEEAAVEAAMKDCQGSIPDKLHGDPIPCMQAKYPGFSGWLSLDLPVYRFDNGLVTTVDFEIGCGPLCGSGSRATLRWLDGHWRLIGTEPTWIS